MSLADPSHWPANQEDSSRRHMEKEEEKRGKQQVVLRSLSHYLDYDNFTHAAAHREEGKR